MAAVLLAGLALRAYPLSMPSFPDPDFYYHLRLAGTAFREGGVPEFDALSYGGRPYTYFPFHHFSAAAFAKLLGIDAYAAVTVITLVVALAAILFAFLLAKKLFGERAGLLAAFSAALMPGFVAKTTAFARPDSYALLLLPAAFLLLLESKNSANFLLFLCFSLIHLPAAVVCFALLALAAVIAGIELKKIAYAGAGLAFGGTYYSGVDLTQFLVSKSFASSVELASLDFPFLLFYSGVFIVFAALGVWKALQQIRSTQFKLLLAWLAGGAALVLAANRNIVFFAPPLAVLAGTGLDEALRKSGGYSKIFVVFVLILLAATTKVFLEQQWPGFTQADVSAAEWLGNNSGGGLVAAHWDRGHFLAFYGSRVFVDGYFEFAPRPVERISAVEELVSTGSEERAKEIVEDNQIEFLFLDEESLALLSENSVWRNGSAPAGFGKVFGNGAAVWAVEKTRIANG